MILSERSEATFPRRVEGATRAAAESHEGKEQQRLRCRSWRVAMSSPDAGSRADPVIIANDRPNPLFLWYRDGRHIKKDALTTEPAHLTI